MDRVNNFIEIPLRAIVVDDIRSETTTNISFYIKYLA